LSRVLLVHRCFQHQCIVITLETSEQILVILLEGAVTTCYTSAVFGRPFVKRFALCYQTVVLSVLSVTLVHIVAKRLDRSRWNLACT